MFKPLKKPYDYSACHCQDVYTNLGFDYHDKIFEKTLSKQLFANPNTKSILKEIQKLIFFLIEETKVLKTRFVFSVDKDSKLIN